MVKLWIEGDSNMQDEGLSGLFDDDVMMSPHISVTKKKNFNETLNLKNPF